MFPYLWQLHFADGSILLQDAGDGVLREWAAVTALLEHGGRIHRIALIPTAPGVPAHVVTVPVGATPVYFRRMAKNVKVELVPAPEAKRRRRRKALAPEDYEIRAEEAPPEEQSPAIICAGWEWPPKGEYVEGTPLEGCYLFAFFDGSCVVTTDREEVNH
jgi:hypothetical protein